MFGLLFNKKTTAAEVICKIALYGDNENQSEASSIKLDYPLQIVLNAPKPCSVAELRKRITGALKAEHDFDVLFHGRVLKDQDVIPHDCYERETENGTDQFFRSRIVICIDLSKKVLQSQFKINEDESEVGNSDIDGENHSTNEDTYQYEELAPPMVDTGPLKRFDLAGELKQIGCEQYAEILIRYGYGTEGAFAMIRKEDFLNNNLWIPERSQQKMVALADRVASKLCLSKGESVPSIRGEKSLSQKVKDKIADVIRISYEVENFDASTLPKQVFNSDCCEKHRNSVDIKYKYFREMGRLSFGSKLKTAVSFINDPGCDIAPINKMIDVAQYYIQSNAPSNEFDWKAFQDYVTLHSKIEGSELYFSNNSLGYNEYCLKVSGYFGNPDVYSKKKFVDTTLNYIDGNFPMFYIVNYV